jgi:hypothetical protein
VRYETVYDSAMREAPRWYDFLSHRRRLVSDVGWYGTGSIIVGVALIRGADGEVRWLGVALAVIGLGLVARAVYRHLRRPDDSTPPPNGPD